MPTYRVKITHICRVERIMLLDIDAPTQKRALASVRLNYEEAPGAPSYDDPRWIEHVDLLSEKVEAA